MGTLGDFLAIVVIGFVLVAGLSLLNADAASSDAVRLP